MGLFRKNREASPDPDDKLLCHYEGNEIDGWTFRLYDDCKLLKKIERTRPFDDTYTEQEAQRTCQNLLAEERRRRATTASGEIRA